MACVLHAWAINRWKKNLVCNLQYGAKTRLIRGIYFWMVNTQSYKYLWFFYSKLCFGFIKWLVLVDGTFQTFFSLFSFHFRAPPSRSFIIPPSIYLDDRPVYGRQYILGLENASPSANYPRVEPSATAHFPISAEPFRKMETAELSE